MLATTGKSGVQHLLLGEAFVRQVTHEIVPALWGVAAAETFAIGLAEIASAEQFTCGERLLAHDLRGEEPLGFLVCFEQTRAFRPGMFALA